MPFDGKTYQPDDEVLNALIGMKTFHSDPKKWCSTGAIGENGSYCIAAAAGRICFLAFKLIRPYLDGTLPPEAHGHPIDGIVHFNERMGTTHEQLMAFYDRAIAARRAELVAA